MGTRIKVGLVLGGTVLAGFLAGRWSSPQPNAAIVLPTVATSTAPGVQAAAAPRAISTLREVLQIKGDFAQTTALHMLVSSLDIKGIERLLEEVPSITLETDRNAASGIIYSRLAEFDPQAAVQRIMRSPEQDLGSLQRVFHAWARMDLQRALEGAGQLQDERNKILALRTIFAARRDMSDAEREAIAVKYKVRIPTRNLGPIDLRTPASAERTWREAIQLTDVAERDARLRQVAYTWVKQSPEAAMRAIEAIDDQTLRDQILMQSAVGWAEKSPRALLDWSMQRRPSSQRAQLLAIALRTLVKDEPQAVMETVQQLSRGEQQQLLPQVMQQWTNNDLENVTAWMAAAKDPSMRSMAVSTIANIYAQRSPDEAMRWAARLPKSESQYVTSMIISQIAAKDPVRGVALLRTVQDDAQRETAAYNIATNWAHRDPQAALAWATRLPPGQGRNNAVTAVIGQWAVYEPSAALQQIASLDDAGLRDSAALQIISSRRFEDMDLTKQVYSRIQGEQAKKQAAMYLYHGLRESDPAEAERYRREAGLPDNYR